jgi:hypothetical protein
VEMSQLNRDSGQGPKVWYKKKVWCFMEEGECLSWA